MFLLFPNALKVETASRRLIISKNNNDVPFIYLQSKSYPKRSIVSTDTFLAFSING